MCSLLSPYAILFYISVLYKSLLISQLETRQLLPLFVHRRTISRRFNCYCTWFSLLLVMVYDTLLYGFDTMAYDFYYRVQKCKVRFTLELTRRCIAMIISFYILSHLNMFKQFKLEKCSKYDITARGGRFGLLDASN